MGVPAEIWGVAAQDYQINVLRIHSPAGAGLCELRVVRSWCLCSPPKELEQMAKEQDKESEKQALLREVENHKKQMLRWVWQLGLLPSPL